MTAMPSSDAVLSHHAVPCAASQRIHSSRAVTPTPTSRSDLLRSFPSLSSVHVHLSPPLFCLSWWLILFLHMVLGSFAFSVTALHWYLQDPTVYMAIASLQVPQQTMRVTARSFFLVGFAHCVAISRMIYHSIKAKRLTLHSITSTTSTGQPTASPRTPRQYIALAIDVVTKTWAKLFSSTGFFGVRGPYFEVIFTFREAMEIVMQTYQAYHLSWSVPRAWINQLAVASIVLNCLASPIVHWRFKANDAKRRLVSLLHDSMLDFCCSVVIPVSIVLPYAVVFDTKAQGFPMELVMDDAWYVNAISEGRQVLVTSFVDYISTLIPQIGLLSCLMTIKNVLRRRSSRSQPTTISLPHERVKPRSAELAVSRPKCSVLHFSHLHGSNRFSLRSEPIQVAQRLHHAARNPKYVRRWRQFFIHIVFLLWGVVVLCLHLTANAKSQQNIVGCQLHVNAWASTGYPCSMMLLNCHEARIQGRSHEIAMIMGGLERSSLQVAIISHCPALEIPPVLTEFSRLGGMELFNCSLADWPMEAAPTETTLPRFGYLFLVLTNWTTFPQGLLHQNLPKLFTHLILAATNLTELPKDIGDAWETQEWITMGIEQAPQLRKLPDSFCRIRVAELVLASTGISSFSSNCFDMASIQLLVLSGSPVTELPLHVGGLQVLAADHTLITELPSWFEDWIRSGPLIASLFGSPVCNSSALHNGTEYWDTLCANDSHTTRGIYPWEFMAPRRPL